MAFIIGEKKSYNQLIQVLQCAKHTQHSEYALSRGVGAPPTGKLIWSIELNLVIIWTEKRYVTLVK